MSSVNINAFSQLVIHGRPYARSRIQGVDLAPYVSGTVLFYPAENGTHVVAEVFGLPDSIVKGGKAAAAGPFHGFHIHEGKVCSPMGGNDPLSETGAHYNPNSKPHPYHAGDLPPLLANKGYAYLSVYTDRFKPADVIGRTIIIHQNPDDFRTQPSGNSGTKIACGVIEKV